MSQLLSDIRRSMRRLLPTLRSHNQDTAPRLGLHGTAFWVLNVLVVNGAMTPGRLANLSGLTTGGTTAAFDRLEQRNFVNRSRGPGRPATRHRHTTPFATERLAAELKDLLDDLEGALQRRGAGERTVIVDLLSDLTAGDEQRITRAPGTST